MNFQDANIYIGQLLHPDRNKKTAPTYHARMSAPLKVSVLPASRMGFCNGLPDHDLEGCNNDFTQAKCIGGEALAIGYVENGHWIHRTCLAKYGFAVGDVLKINDDDKVVKLPELSEDNQNKNLPTLLSDIAEPRTQKARGVRLLAQYGSLDSTIIIQNEEQLKGCEVLFKKLTSVVFKARPCPITPRHGFVETRDVGSFEELCRVWEEARAADPEAEVLLMPSIQADWSAIVTPNSLVWGRSNDGATSGKGAQTLLLGGGKFNNLVPAISGQATKTYSVSQTLLDAAGILKDQFPYLEFVFEDMKPICVQIRGGPKSKPVLDYIPKKMIVKAVHKLDFEVNDELPEPSPCECYDEDECECPEPTGGISVEDMLAWEALVPTLPKGTVVYHPGGSINCHFGVHCVLNKVAYITTYEPKVGDTISPPKKNQPIEREALRRGMRVGIVKGEKKYKVDFKKEAATAMFMLHNFPSDHGPLGSWMLGHSASRLYRLLALACLGEYRHYPGEGGSSKVSTQWAIQHGFIKNDGTIATEKLDLMYGYRLFEPWRDWYHSELEGTEYAGGNRHEVFQDAWMLDHHELQARLTVATRSFLEDKWIGGFGGLNWGRCGLAALRLYDAMIAVDEKPSLRRIKVLVELMNKIVNMVHNNGNVFNKFIGTQEKNYACKLNRDTLLKHVFPRLVKVDVNQDGPTFNTVAKGLWRDVLGPDLEAYADNPLSPKRRDFKTGDPAEVVAVALGGIVKAAWITYTKQVGMSLNQTTLLCGVKKKKAVTMYELDEVAF